MKRRKIREALKTVERLPLPAQEKLRRCGRFFVRSPAPPPPYAAALCRLRRCGRHRAGAADDNAPVCASQTDYAAGGVVGRRNACRLVRGYEYVSRCHLQWENNMV